MILLFLIACQAGLPTETKGAAETTGDSVGVNPNDSTSDSTPSESGGDSQVEETADTGPVTESYPAQRVGIFYLAWHAYAAKAMASLPESERYTIDDVIVADGLSPAALLYNEGLYNTAMGFHYHQEPALGYYCLYRPRDGEAPYDEPYAGPDCGDISAMAEAHATELWDAGVDFVYVDLPNLPTYTPFGDVLGLRPLEVLPAGRRVEPGLQPAGLGRR